MMKLWQAGLTFCVMASATACKDSTGPAAGSPVSLSFSTKAVNSGGAIVQANGAAFDVAVTGGGNTLIITRVQMVLRKIELKRSNTVACPDTDSSHSEACEELRIGPMLLDLPLSTSVLTPFSVSIPAGTYRELELKVHKPGNDARDQAFKAANPAFADTSIRVEGTYNGRAFVFTSRVSEEMELEFNPPLTIGETGGNVTVQIDVATWFRAASGAVIDPATANIGGLNEGIVKSNIKASFRALDDDNRDGK
ncbi:MAG: hypothetical protein NTW72_03820 [Gemmatimonadetes bacterium]|nr:hypothetical protein [Gemmatimonadota bacterium]